MKQGLEFASAVFALIAAALWFASAWVRVPKKYPPALANKQADDLRKAVSRQSRWSASAAVGAGIAAACQGIAFFL
jgi:hypothetical protein